MRATGRDTSGVRGIGMKDGVSVLVMEVTNGNGDLFVITERGYGKRTPVADYPEQNRGGQGVYTIQMTERKGNLAAMKTVGPQHELFIVTEGATVIRVKTDEIEPDWPRHPGRQDDDRRRQRPHLRRSPHDSRQGEARRRSHRRRLCPRRNPLSI